jgi:hypothetical protein
MGWALAALGLIALTYLVWSGRRPIHYRRVGELELADFVPNLLEDAVGSKLVVEDEGSGTTVVVEKVRHDPTVQQFALVLEFSAPPMGLQPSTRFPPRDV